MDAGFSRRRRRSRRIERRYRPLTLILETIHETAEGSVRVIDFMPPRGKAPDIVRIVEGISGRVPMRSELIIRFDYGHIVPWVRRIDHARVAIAGPDALCLRTPVDVHGEELTTVSDFVVEPGERVPFVLTWFPSHEAVAGAGRRRGGAGRNRVVLARVGGRRPASRAAPRGDPSVAAGAQGAHLRPNRRDRGRADDLAAGADRRRPQLGLPLLLAARREPDPPGDAQRRLPATRRRPGASGSCGRSPATPPRCRSCTASPASAASRSASIEWLPGFADSRPGAGRQCRLAPAPARRLRRGAGRGLPDAGARHRGLGVRLVADQATPGLAGGRLAGERCRHLGSARAVTGTSRTRR